MALFNRTRSTFGDATMVSPDRKSRSPLPPLTVPVPTSSPLFGSRPSSTRPSSTGASSTYSAAGTASVASVATSCSSTSSRPPAYSPALAPPQLQLPDRDSASTFFGRLSHAATSAAPSLSRFPTPPGALPPLSRHSAAISLDQYSHDAWSLAPSSRLSKPMGLQPPPNWLPAPASVGQQSRGAAPAAPSQSRYPTPPGRAFLAGELSRRRESSSPHESFGRSARSIDTNRPLPPTPRDSPAPPPVARGFEARYAPSHGPSMDRRPPSPARTFSRRELGAWIRWWARETTCLAVAAGCISGIAIALGHADGKPPSGGVAVTVAVLSMLARLGILGAMASCVAQAGWNAPTPSYSGQRRRSSHSYSNWESWRSFRVGARRNDRTSGIEMLVAGSQAGRKLLDIRDAQRVAGVGGIAAVTACLRVLFSRRGNAAPLVALGALVILLVLVGFEPSVQAMVGVQEGTRAEDGGAVRAVREIGGAAFGNIISVPNAQSSLEQTIDDCLIHGQNHAPILDASCPKGRNCTFPPIETLGICSSCSDVTSRLRLVDFKFAVPIDTVTGTGHTRVVDLTTTYSLPDGSEISYTVQSTLRGATASSLMRETLTGQDTLVITGTRGDQRIIANGRDGPVVPLLTVAVLTVRRAAAGETSEDIFRQGVKAKQCSLVPCIQTLDIQVRDGKEMVAVVDEYIDMDDLRNGDWLTRGLELFKPSAHRGGNATSGSQPAGNTRFFLDREVAVFLQQRLLQQLNITQSINAALDVSTTETILGSDDAMLVLSNPMSSNAADGIASIAAMATTFLHRLGSMVPVPSPTMHTSSPTAGSPNPIVPGVASTTLLVVYVRWGFFVVPLLALLLAATLLPMVAASTARRRAPLWKDETLALLFHSVELGDVEPARRRAEAAGVRGDPHASRFYGEKKRAFDDLETASGMRQVAGDVRVTLEGDGGASGGRRLVVRS